MTRHVQLAFALFIGFAICLVGALPAAAQSGLPRVSLNKRLCVGVPAQTPADSACTMAVGAPANQPVFYVMTVSGLPGMGFQLVQLNDTLPAGFVPGGFGCVDQSGAVVPVSGGGTGVLGSVGVQDGAVLTCTLPGAFSATGPVTNTAVAAGDNWSTPSTSNAVILPATALTSDLSIEKKVQPVTPPNLNLPVTVKYTITIKNNGPGDVEIGQWFNLHDTLRLGANSVPLFAQLVSGSFTCAQTGGADCLDPAGPTITNGGNTLIGTMAPKHMFSWGFASTSAGKIPNGASISIEFKLKIQKIPSLACYKVVNADALINEAYFTLTSATSAGIDQNAANNTSSATVNVNTGATTQDPNCGDGQIKVTKVQVNPAPGALVTWNSNVSYDITIKNVSVPNLPITIPAGAFQDFVIEGVNTPPFWRDHVSSSCLNSAPAAICTGFNGGAGGFNPDPSYKLSYYGESRISLTSTKNIVLPANGNSATFRVTFRYRDPACDTVENATPKPIFNKAVVNYNAPPVGGGASIDQTATAIIDPGTTMVAPARCKFAVTKKRLSGDPVNFWPGTSTLTYEVTYTNNEAPNFEVGTVADVVRVTNPAYASPLTYTSSWNCSVTNGTVGNVNLIGGPIAGQAVSTQYPHQGTPAMQLRLNPALPLKFGPVGSQLRCKVSIVFNRPKSPANCTTKPAQFENLAFMDMTHPFNSNAMFPPSGSYNAGAQYNPSLGSQNLNWASHRQRLPKCFDAILNKEASVPGLQSGQAWTYVNGPQIDYTVTVRNTAADPLLGNALGGGGWNGLLVRDNFASPYANASVTNPSPYCSTNWTCNGASPRNPKAVIGVQSLLPQTDGKWFLSQPGPFTTVGVVENCALLKPVGQFTGHGWYPNFDPSLPLCQGKGQQSDVVQVPVLKTTSLTIKKLWGGYGSNVIGPQTFTFNVTCSPYGLISPPVTLPVTITAPANVVVSQTIQPVPLFNGETCTVTEVAPTPPTLPPTLPCNGNLSWMTSQTPATPVPITANAATNVVSFTNKLVCTQSHPTVKISVRKIVRDFTGYKDGNGVPVPIPSATTFNVDVVCNGSVVAQPIFPSTGGSQSVNAMSGATCSANETPPPEPAGHAAHCASINKTAKWVVSYNPASVVAANGQVLGVYNDLTCVGATPGPVPPSP